MRVGWFYIPHRMSCVLGGWTGADELRARGRCDFNESAARGSRRCLGRTLLDFEELCRNNAKEA